MQQLSPQTMSLWLSLLGIVVLLACLVMIGLKRVPELSVPQKLKGFGLDLNISVVTLLVLVGLILALTSTFLQVKNYDSELSAAAQKAKALEAALAQARRMNVNARITLGGLNDIKDVSLDDLQASYYVEHPDSPTGGWVPGKVTPGVYGLEFILTLEDITPRTRIEAIEVVDRNPKHPRKWAYKDVGYVLTPTYKLVRTE